MLNDRPFYFRNPMRSKCCQLFINKCPFLTTSILIETCHQTSPESCLPGYCHPTFTYTSYSILSNKRKSQFQANPRRKSVNTYPPRCPQDSSVAQWVKNSPAMQETWVWSLGQEDPLKEGMATHSRILAWRIPWTEETGRLQSKGSQRVRHDWAQHKCFQGQKPIPRETEVSS